MIQAIESSAGIVEVLQIVVEIGSNRNYEEYMEQDT